MRDFASEQQADGSSGQDAGSTVTETVVGSVFAVFRSKLVDRLAFMTGMALYVMTCVVLVLAVWALTT